MVVFKIDLCLVDIELTINSLLNGCFEVSGYVMRISLQQRGVIPLLHNFCVNLYPNSSLLDDQKIYYIV